MSDSSARGQLIEDRLKALGISDREFHDQTGIDRKTLRRAVLGEDRVRPSTYAAIEAAIDKLETRVAGVSISPADDPSEDLVEFIVEGNFGVRAIVKGPVRDMEALQAAVARLVKDMQSRDD